MRLPSLLAGVLLISSSCAALADVTFTLQADELKDQGGTPVAAGTLYLIVASEGDNVFGSIQANSTTTVGSSLNGGDDIVVARGIINGLGTLDTQISLTLGGNLQQNVPLELVWLPTLTLASSTTLTLGTPYGAYTDSVGLDGSAPWVVPRDGSTVALNFYTKDGTIFSPGAAASNPASAGLASMSVVIPEPTSAAMLFCALGFFGLRRSRRS